MNARDAVEALVDAACPDRQARRTIDLFEDTVRAEARAAAYREAAADLSAWAAEGLLNAPEYGSHENVLDAADRLRARADQMEQP